MSTIGTSTPRIGTGYTGGTISAGGAGATNNAAGYYGQGSGTTGQVANGFNNFVQGGSQLIDAGGGGGGEGGGGTINPMPKFNSPILAKSQQNQGSSGGELSASGGSKKKLASIFDEDGGGEGGGGGGE
jgi:hypothetical protein